MIYAILYQERRGDNLNPEAPRYLIKIGTALDLRNRLNTHKIYLGSPRLMGVTNGHYYVEQRIHGLFSEEACNSLGPSERFNLSPRLIQWIYDNMTLDVPEKVTGKIPRFDWKAFWAGDFETAFKPDEPEIVRRYIKGPGWIMYIDSQFVPRNPKPRRKKR